MHKQEGFTSTILGEMPTDWELTNIESVCAILDSKRRPLNKDQRESMKGSIPYYGANGVVDYIDRYLFDENLILLAEDGGNFSEYRTKPIAYKVKGKSWVNNHAHILKPHPDVIFDWIFYSLVHKNILEFINGGTRSKLNQADLRKLPISLPPFKEQQKIAEILSSVDEAIEKTEAIIKQTETVKKGLMQQLLTKGIGHTEFQQTEVGIVPAHWSVKKIGDILGSSQYGISVSLHLEPNGIPVLRMGNVQNGYIRLDDLKYVDDNEVNLDEYLLNYDDVLFNRTNSEALVGKTGIYKGQEKASFASYLIRLRGKPELITQEYLNYYMNTDTGQTRIRAHISKGVSQANINATNLKKVLIPLPPLSEQKRITSIIFVFDEKLAQENMKKENLVSLKKSLMQSLLTGKVRVNVDQPEVLV